MGPGRSSGFRTLFTAAAVMAGAVLSPFTQPTARADFIPGHIFVADTTRKHCAGPPRYTWDRIWEIDPETGVSWLFAELAEEWCGGIHGLVFTPDGTHLRGATDGPSRVFEFDSDGHFEVIHDISDGIVAPFGKSSITYDCDGNFYVASSNMYAYFRRAAVLRSCSRTRLMRSGRVGARLLLRRLGKCIWGNIAGHIINCSDLKGRML